MSERIRMHRKTERDPWARCWNVRPCSYKHGTAVLLDAEDEKTIDKAIKKLASRPALGLSDTDSMRLVLILRPDKP